MRIKSIIKGTVASVIIIAAVIVLAAVILYFTDIGETAANVIVYAGAALGVLFGAFIAAKSCGQRVLLHSLSVSLLCIIALVIASFALNGGIYFNVHLVLAAAGSILAGFAGAVMGK